MRFDAYAGNISGSKPEEVATLAALGVRGRVERGRPRGRYHDVFDVMDGPELVGWVAHDYQLDTAYFEFKGARTPESSGVIRKYFYDTHRVSRLDACEDYDDPAAFDRLVALMDRAKDPRVHSDLMAPRDGDRGRTIYWGSKTSRSMVRVYEAGKMKERLHFGRPDWCRAEAQVRPGKSIEKLAAAFVTPLDAWGFAAWTKRAAEELSMVDVTRYAPPASTPTFDRTTLYLARAFRRHFEAMAEDFGDWTCIGREIEAIWAADDEAKDKAL